MSSDFDWQIITNFQISQSRRLRICSCQVSCSARRV